MLLRTFNSFLVGFSLFLCFPVLAFAWESDLFGPEWNPNSNLNFETDKIIQDFSYAGYRRGEQPIPFAIPGKVFNAVTEFGADRTGASDSTQAIQNAIAAAKAQGGGTVYLPAGTYKVAPQDGKDQALLIDASGIVLKGAGRSETFILNIATDMRSKAVITVSGPSSADWYVIESPSVSVTADLMNPTKIIPVSSTTGFSVGDYIVIRADPTDEWATEHKELDWVGYAGQYGYQLYYRQIKAINSSAKTLEIDIPIRYYIKKRENPLVFKKTGTISEIGLSDFSIGNVQHPATTGWTSMSSYNSSSHPTYEVHSSNLIYLRNVRNSWISDVHSFQAPDNTSTAHMLSNGIRFAFVHNTTIRRCNFQRPQFGGGGGNGYMYRLMNSSENLISESVAEFSRHGFVISHFSATGNVIYRSSDRVTGKSTGSTGEVDVNGSSSDHHQFFSHSNLVDTSSTQDSFFAAKYRPHGSGPTHGLTAAHSVFWNLEGLAPSRYSYVVSSQQSRFGYVIGTRGSKGGAALGGTNQKTDPIDHSEGIGAGSTLSPFSLFEEQRRRRLADKNFDIFTPADYIPPETPSSLKVRDLEKE